MFITTLHKQKCLANVAAEKIGAGVSDAHAPITHASHPIDSTTALTTDVIYAALQQDLSALHELTDVAKKIALKKDHLIPKWLPILQQYRDSGAQYPSEALVYFVIWLLDAEQIDLAIDWADFAIKQQQPMPQRFNRNLETFAAETVHDWAQRQFKDGHSAEPYLTQVIERIESRQWLVDQCIVLNKLYKLVGQYAEAANDFEKAEKYYLLCVDVNPEKHGVKTKLEAVQRRLGKL